ncbi:MAG: lamin tail domain-containing protein [Anaerolineales bacterium]
MKKIFLLCLMSIVFVISACSTFSLKAEPTIVFREADIVISEVMAGIEGNNNQEFIELYNAGDALADLDGWSLWYRLATNDDEVLVHQWTGRTLVPPRGHYLLVRDGQSFIEEADAYFYQGLNNSGAGLSLRDNEGTQRDSLGWGNAPSQFTEGAVAPALENGTSLERKPGGIEGNSDDDNDNASDFQLSDSPHPQNVSSPASPAQGEMVRLHLTAPDQVTPGSNFEYILTVSNPSEATMHDIHVEFSLPLKLDVIEPPQGWKNQEGTYTWQIEELEPGEELAFTFQAGAPWEYFTAEAKNVLASPADTHLYSFAEVARTAVEGGVVPIGIARNLIGSDITIEGIATMYTGGFYAGSGAKLYLEDESGGVQIYVPGGAGTLDVPIGAVVRVSGVIEPYRGAIELIPEIPEDVELLAPPDPAQLPVPEPVSIRQAANDAETLPGRLLQVEGTATRVEEFNYSYEIDLVDEDGQILTLYIDKLTEFNIETIEEGRRYRATGIHEARDTDLLLNPRTQDDLEEIFPPELILSIQSPTSVRPDEKVPVTITATNHTNELLTDVHISLPDKFFGGTLVEAPEKAGFGDSGISVPIGDLEPSGGFATLEVVLQPDRSTEIVEIRDYSASGLESASASSGPERLVFVGQGVPIWAIQGHEKSSPYKLEYVQTQGIVTGVFPELGGFWIQEDPSDDDPETSAGLFVNLGEMELTPNPGDLIEVSGRIREISGQTQLEVSDLANIQVLRSHVALPQPVSLDPPADEEIAAMYYEDREGMLVDVVGPAIAVSPTSKYGEYALILPQHGMDRVLRGDPVGMLIHVDDGSEAVHYDNVNLPYVVTTGDHVENVSGPLAYTFGQYKIEPTSDPMVTPSGSAPPQTIEPGAFSVMTWNVENLFDILDPHPSDPPRPRKAEYDLALTKVANTIDVSGAPTVVGLQEVENIGILEDLAENEILADYQYVPYLIEGTDSRGIDVGYLIRGDQAEVLDVGQFTAPDGLTSRPPLMVKIDLKGDGSSTSLYVLNNHFTSMAGGEVATEPRRAAQAEWNIQVMEKLLAEDPTAQFIILGDLNSFYDSRPIEILREAGLMHVFENLPLGERYNYIYQGVSQTLDHILISPELMDAFQKVVLLHVNADFPPAETGDPSPIRKSDHDPVIAIFANLP